MIWRNGIWARNWHISLRRWSDWRFSVREGARKVLHWRICDTILGSTSDNGFYGNGLWRTTAYDANEKSGSRSLGIHLREDLQPRSGRNRTLGRDCRLNKSFLPAFDKSFMPFFRGKFCDLYRGLPSSFKGESGVDFKLVANGASTFNFWPRALVFSYVVLEIRILNERPQNYLLSIWEVLKRAMLLWPLARTILLYDTSTNFLNHV